MTAQKTENDASETPSVSDTQPGGSGPQSGNEIQEQPEGLKGVEAIRHALRTMPYAPGVYRMLGARGEVRYVGKARRSEEDTSESQAQDYLVCRGLREKKKKRRQS